MIGHILLALLTQLAVARLTRSWLAGAMVAAAWAISREITQAEYRWIERFGDGRRANMPWWGGFDLRVWERVDPWLDWAAPTALVLVIALTMRQRAETAAPSRNWTDLEG